MDRKKLLVCTLIRQNQNNKKNHIFIIGNKILILENNEILFVKYILV